MHARQEYFNRKLVNAAEKGNLEEVKECLQQSMLSSKALLQAMLNAIEQRHSSVVNAMFQSSAWGHKFTEVGLVRAAVATEKYGVVAAILGHVSKKRDYSDRFDKGVERKRNIYEKEAVDSMFKTKTGKKVLQRLLDLFHGMDTSETPDRNKIEKKFIAIATDLAVRLLSDKDASSLSHLDYRQRDIVIRDTIFGLRHPETSRLYSGDYSNPSPEDVLNALNKVDHDLRGECIKVFAMAWNGAKAAAQDGTTSTSALGRFVETFKTENFVINGTQAIKAERIQAWKPKRIIVSQTGYENSEAKEVIKDTIMLLAREETPQLAELENRIGNLEIELIQAHENAAEKGREDQEKRRGREMEMDILIQGQAPKQIAISKFKAAYKALEKAKGELRTNKVALQSHVEGIESTFVDLAEKLAENLDITPPEGLEVKNKKKVLRNVLFSNTSDLQYKKTDSKNYKEMNIYIAQLRSWIYYSITKKHHALRDDIIVAIQQVLMADSTKPSEVLARFNGRKTDLKNFELKIEEIKQEQRRSGTFSFLGSDSRRAESTSDKGREEGTDIALPRKGD